MHRLHSLSVVVLALAACAEPCDAAGCSSLLKRAGQNGPGIAGVVAEMSDVVANDCQECPLASASLRLWRVEKAVTSKAKVQTLMESTPPSHTLAANEQYRLALEAGRYLLCVDTSCVNVAVASETVTVNIKRRFGPTSFFVVEPDSGRFIENYGIRLDV